MTAPPTLPNTEKKKAAFRHQGKPVTSPFVGMDERILSRAVRNVSPGLATVSVQKLGHQHPNIVKYIEREYARLVEVMK